MKQVKFLAAITVAAGMLFLSSCNSGEDKKTEASSADTTEVKAETPAPTTPVTSTFMTIKHKVANYEKWKPVYDSHGIGKIMDILFKRFI